MYRLYGIQARYATGYAVDPSDFEYRPDGRGHAEMTDQSAHAWPEIFVRDYGWIPVEVTPSGETEAETSEEMTGRKEQKSDGKKDVLPF